MSPSSQGAPCIGDPSSLSRYVARINSFPILGKDEEFLLAQKWKETNDTAAIDKIVKSHLHLVLKMARGYRGYGLPLEDLVAEGSIGIMQAVRNFDPERGFRFSTYARWWIKASMQEYIMHSWSLVKIGTQKAHKKIFFSLNRLKRALGLGEQLTQEEAEQVAKELEVPADQVLELNRRFSAADFSLNASRSGESDGEEWLEWISTEEDSPEAIAISQQERTYRYGLLRKGLRHLTPREFQVLTLRRFSEEEKTLEEIGKELRISRERVRQIESAAFLKLQKHVRKLQREKPKNFVKSCIFWYVLSQAR